MFAEAFGGADGRDFAVLDEHGAIGDDAEIAHGCAPARCVAAQGEQLRGVSEDNRGHGWARLSYTVGSASSGGSVDIRKSPFQSPACANGRRSMDTRGGHGLIAPANPQFRTAGKGRPPTRYG